MNPHDPSTVPAEPRPRPACAPSRWCGGFTLVELLVAITLMAVLAVLGWRGLDSVLRSRERIAEVSDSLRAMSLGFSQLEDDLRRSWAVGLMHLPAPSIAFVADTPDGPPTLQLLREMPPDSGPVQLQRVAYRLRDGVWERGFATWVMPAPEGAQAVAEPPMTWQALVGEVTSLQLRGYVAGAGWVPATGLLSRPGARATGNPITGIEALVQRRNGERVLRVLGVRD